MEYFLKWIENIAFYLIIITIILQLIPNPAYKKYIQFFMGLILILMLSGPIFKILNIKEEFQQFYQEAEYEQKKREIEQATRYLEDITSEME